MKKIFLYITIFLLLSLISKGQQIPNLTQYVFNLYSLNPAATGINESFPVSFCYRKLWAGIKGSPSIQYLSGHTKVSNDMAGGAKIFNFQTGPIRKTGIELTYSYHLPLNAEGLKLSFGLSTMFYQFFLNKSALNVEDPDDIIFTGSEKMIVPDATFGIFLYSNNYFAGLSIPQLFNRNIDLKTDKILQQKQVRHYYLHGGYLFNFNEDWNLEPSILMKFVEAGLFQIDLNFITSYKKTYQFGLSFRSGDALMIILGYNFNNIRVSYSFDLIINKLRYDAFGSHEIMFQNNFKNFIR